MRLLALLFVASACNPAIPEETLRDAFGGIDGSFAIALPLAVEGFAVPLGTPIPPRTVQGPAGGSLTLTAEHGSQHGHVDVRLDMANYAEDGPRALSFTTIRIHNYNIMFLGPITDFDFQYPGEHGYGGMVEMFVDYSGDVRGRMSMTLSIEGQVRTTSTREVLILPGTTRITGTAHSQNDDEQAQLAVDLTF